MIETFETTARQMGGSCDVKVVRNYEGYEIAMDNPVIEISEKAARQPGMSSFCASPAAAPMPTYSTRWECQLSWSVAACKTYTVMTSLF